MEKKITTVTISTDLRQIEPLQRYVTAIAELLGMAADKQFHLNILVEEVLAHIFSEAFDGRNDGSVTIEISHSHGDFILRFSYLGLPFGYSWENIKDEGDAISLKLISRLSTSYSMAHDGKRGQRIELHISLPATDIDAGADTSAMTTLASDDVTLREIHDDEMKMLVQCFYRVFGYSYSAEGVYYPESILERKRGNVYRGFVGINSKGEVIAHTAALKDSPDDKIVECGQAFVMPQYGKRGLFHSLKQMLIDYAEKQGLMGVRSSAVTEHEYTQRANLDLQCIETGLELGYIPGNLVSNVSSDRKGQRQTVINFFRPLGVHAEVDVYVPECYADIVEKTYGRLSLPRRILHPEQCPFEGETSIKLSVKTEWNQLHVTIDHVGSDLDRCIETMLRNAPLMGARVVYFMLDIEDKATPQVVEALRRAGFFYGGVTPYMLHGKDALTMQYLLGEDINPDYVKAVSPWGQELKAFVFKDKLQNFRP